MVTFNGRKSSSEDVMAVLFAHGRRPADASRMTDQMKISACSGGDGETGVRMKA
jgi:hypothetical protein